MVVIGNFTHNFIPELKDIKIDFEVIEKEGVRLYRTPDGLFPSVTTVVGHEKRKKYKNWRENNAKESQRVCDRGTMLHSTIESYLLNEHVEMNNNSPVFDLFHLIKKEVDNIKDVYATEAFLWGKCVGLAGRVDCIAKYKGEPSVIDFKASTFPKKKVDIDNYFCQATAYSLMLQERTGIQIPNIVILIANEQGFCQVFKEKVINYVEPLSNMIATYKKEVNFDDLIQE
jgi:genome maintenance exonuclease 1